MSRESLGKIVCIGERERERDEGGREGEKDGQREGGKEVRRNRMDG